MPNWSQQEVERLPRISFDYVFPYLNEIKEHPEIYEQKALFMDLVATGLHDNLCISDDAKLFIREQLETNGTMGALRNGTFNEFIAQEAQKEGYTPYRIRSENNEKLNKSLMGLLTRDEQLAKYVQQSEHFDYELVLHSLKDHETTDMLVDQFKRFRETQKNKGKNPWTDNDFSSMTTRNAFTSLLEHALRVGNTQFALEALRDMAENSQPETSAKTNNPEVNFLSYVHWLGDAVKKNGIQGEVDQIVEKYKERPEVKFHLEANPLAKARKKLAQKIDARLGTNLEDVKLGKPLKKVENAVAKVLFSKGTNKNNR